jgi:hypothetical protein
MAGAEAHEAQVAKCEDDLGQRSYSGIVGAQLGKANDCFGKRPRNRRCSALTRLKLA